MFACVNKETWCWRDNSEFTLSLKLLFSNLSQGSQTLRRRSPSKVKFFWENVLKLYQIRAEAFTKAGISCQKPKDGVWYGRRLERRLILSVLSQMCQMFIFCLQELIDFPIVSRFEFLFFYFSS